MEKMDCYVLICSTWGTVLLRGMNKNELIQFSDSQMYLPVVLTQ